jgi:Family of unknown function (DUF5696)
MPRIAIPIILVSLLSFGSFAQDLTVALPLGETALADIGMYAVAYQSYGGDVVRMPPSWTGHFTAESGIAYVPHETVLGRDAILLHSPWKVPAGKVWVDYRLRLPDVAPLTFSFGIAMRPDIAVPGKSDGVTFSCYLMDGEGERELMRAHQAEAAWQDSSFDLAPWAGKVITLRFQTEPGPANSPSFDFSYFGDAKITCGSGEDGQPDLVEQLTTTKAYRATAGIGLEKLCNSPDRGVIPSNLLDYENTVGNDGTAWLFTYDAADCRIVYRYELATGTLDDFTVQMDDAPPFQPAVGGGISVTREVDGKKVEARLTGGEAQSVELAPGGKTLSVVWEYPIDGESLRAVWNFAIVGKALCVTVAADEPVVSAFSLGSEGQTPLRKTFGVPYLAGGVKYLPAQNAFTCRYLDWTASHASRCPQGEATYEAKTDGTRNPLRETGYIAVSPNVNEVLPNIPHPPSPYLSELGPRIMLDVWGHHKGTYQGDAENLRNLKDNGVDHLAIISHVWQRYGYDVKLPDHLPANPQFGGDEGMVEFGKAANDCGYLWSLHENYIDLYPDAPSYDETAAVLRADGSMSPAWFNAGTGVQSYGLKCNRALEYAKQNAPEVHRRFKTTAAYLDVHTCVPPWHQLDYDATQPMAAMALHKVERDAELFQYMRDTHEGPLFGEGANHFYWAGLCDGAEAQVRGGENHTPFLDFDLLKLHPQMANHGMGYYERWFTRGYSHAWGHDTGTVEQVDKYRAQEIAYGHAGFIGNAQTDNIQWVAKEHHMVHPVQRLYGTAKPTEITYEVDGRFVSASVALAAGERGRQRIRYDSGLTVWVNWNREPWEVEGRLLPQWGFLALGPDTEVCTVLREGKFADYAACPEYVFVDARTSFNMPYMDSRKDIEPQLAELKDLGNGRASITYRWVVNDTLDTDNHCFVHFTAKGSSHSDGIVFQQDHEPPKPTSRWKPGDVITDGPYEIALPAEPFESYDIVIGLYGGPRVPLKGIQSTGGRVLIGRMKIKREGGGIAGIESVGISESDGVDQVARADFAAHLNPAGTWIDFGTVATDGSVKVNRDARGLTVFPYPRDREFTVSLDVKAIAGEPNPDTGSLRLQAVLSGGNPSLQDHPFRIADGRLVFVTRGAGSGHYLVTW